MKIFQYRGKHPNFGDELNSWLWPRLLPGFFDDDARVNFIGIGSTIGDAPRDGSTNIIFGAGYVPDYHSKPDLSTANWKCYFVRGPRTAKRLDLPPEMAISDSGILLRTQVDLSKKSPDYIAFMPHWESMERGNWEAVCRRAGVTLIDPRLPVDDVIAAMLRARCIIAEAMHGAIIADAFRIPWIAVTPLNHVHRDKWYDWAESLNITLAPERLFPSSLTEFSKAALQTSPVNETAASEPSALQSPSLLQRLKHAAKACGLEPLINLVLIQLAAQSMKKLANKQGMLSSDTAMEDATTRMLDKLEELRRDFA